MENRFHDYALLELEPLKRLEAKPAKRRRGPALSTAKSFVSPLSASQRALVILIENGGIDLDVGGLVDKLISLMPGGNFITASMRQDLAKFIREKIKSATDTLIESAELALNRYGSAAPQHYDSVAVLRDGTATYGELKAKLIALSGAGKMIDLLILTHGGEDHISAGSGINGKMIKDMKAEHGKALNLRSVYMMNCVGASLNEAWIAAGAKVSSGSIRNNYLPEPTTHFFWENWKAGQTFEAAATNAYRRTVKLMNDIIRGFVRALPVPGSGLIADQIDVETMQFVIDSAPVIQGQRSVGIASDDLVFGQSLSSGLATTVVPVSLLQALGRRALSTDGELAQSASYRYVSPSGLTLDPANRYSQQQNPAAPVIAGIAVADAIQIGLGAAAIVQAGITSVSGSFSLTWDSASRLLTNEARQAMPGAQSAKKSYSTQLFKIGVDKWPFAEAEVIIEWEGNAYGEIGTAVIRKNLKTSSDWSKSSCNITIRKLERIPAPGVDPRAWPIVFSYDGVYDPAANGMWEFSGEFEINAFGGLRFNRHEVESRAAVEWAISKDPHEYVKRGPAIIVPTPTIPDEQVKYLKSKLP